MAIGLRRRLKRLVKSQKIVVRETPKVTERSRRCSVCGTTIHDHNWYVITEIVYPDGRIVCNNLHDDRMCRDTLLLSLGLIKPSFYTSLCVNTPNKSVGEY